MGRGGEDSLVRPVHEPALECKSGFPMMLLQNIVMKRLPLILLADTTVPIFPDPILSLALSQDIGEVC